MRSKANLLIWCMFIFILVHLLLSQLGFFINVDESIMPMIGGLLPAIIYSDSLSTRNPALEAFFTIISDLPGAYSFYRSPIFATANISNLPTWSNFQGNFETLRSVKELIMLIIVFLILITVIRGYIFFRKSKV